MPALSWRYHVGLKRSDLKAAYKACTAHEKREFKSHYDATGAKWGAFASRRNI